MRRAPLVFALVLLACGAPRRDPRQYPISASELAGGSAALEPGEAAYRRTCISCHGVDGKGQDGRVAADLTNPAGPMSRQDEELLASIREGKRGAIGVMPAHGGLLSPAEQTAVLAYVRSHFGVAEPPPPPPPDAGVDGAVARP